MHARTRSAIMKSRTNGEKTLTKRIITSEAFVVGLCVLWAETIFEPSKPLSQMLPSITVADRWNPSAAAQMPPLSQLGKIGQVAGGFKSRGRASLSFVRESLAEAFVIWPNHDIGTMLLAHDPRHAGCWASGQ